uniref:Transmembrane protein n=1 Tax=Panagrellus redivivus TaxID=6233 RepID=A0A7E4ZXL2_PANRE
MASNPSPPKHIQQLTFDKIPLRETRSSLILQIALNFHVYLDPFVYISLIGCLYMKYAYLDQTYRIVLVAVVLISTCIELIRPYLGYYGNLGERIPALSGFWIATLILQIPICTFLVSNPEIRPLPLELFLLSAHLIFLLIEVISAFMLVRSLADYQIQRFKTQIAEDNDDGKTKEDMEYVMHHLLPEGTEFDVDALPKNLTSTLVRTFKKQHDNKTEAGAGGVEDGVHKKDN